MGIAVRQLASIAALLFLALVTSPAIGERATDPPLTKVRTWSLSERDLDRPASPQPYRLRLQMAVVSGGRWEPRMILEATRRAAPILAQCGIQVSSVELHEFDAPSRYRYLSTPVSREFARRAALRKPAIFFVDDTLQRPAFDAEAVGRANARTRPEMADTVWMTAAIRDLPIALAHELVHVLTNSGDHTQEPGNLMHETTAPGSDNLTFNQCRRIVAIGQANGLLAPHQDARRR